MNKASVVFFMKGTDSRQNMDSEGQFWLKSTGIDWDFLLRKFAKNYELYTPSCMCKWINELEGLDVVKKDKGNDEFLSITRGEIYLC